MKNISTIPIILLTPLEKFYNMDSLEMREAFSQWLKEWSIELWGEVKHRSLAKQIKVSHVTLGSWLEETAFPSSASISKICQVRGIDEATFWQQLQHINQQQRKEKGIITSRNNLSIKEAEDVLAIAQQLSEQERYRLIQLLLEQTKMKLFN